MFPPVSSITDVRADALAAFFADCWVSRFKKYDASYLLPQAAVEEEVRAAIRDLLSAPTTAPHV